MKTLDWIKTNLTFLLILLLLALVIFQCSHSGAQLATSELLNKKKIENANNVVAKLQHENADIENEKSKVIEKYNILIKNNVSLQNSITELKAITKTRIDKIKTFSRSDIAKFYDERYNLPEQVKTTANGTELSDNVAKYNIEEITECDATFSELATTKKILENTTKEVVVKDSIWHLTEKQYSNSIIQLSQKDTTIINVQKNQVANIQKQFKGERLKKNIWKIGTFGAVAIILKMILVK